MPHLIRDMTTFEILSDLAMRTFMTKAEVEMEPVMVNWAPHRRKLSKELKLMLASGMGHNKALQIIIANAIDKSAK